MKYFNEMFEKYGFGDGETIPIEAPISRHVYIKALNAVASALKSNVRVVAYDRPGVHNPCMLMLVPADFFAELTTPQIEGDEDIDGLEQANASVAADDAWQAAIISCRDLDLDAYVICEPTVDPRFDQIVELLADGWRPTPEDFD